MSGVLRRCGQAYAQQRSCLQRTTLGQQRRGFAAGLASPISDLLISSSYVMLSYARMAMPAMSYG